MTLKKPPLRIQPTTLWDYPSQDYGDEQQGNPNYKGATPSYIIWNLLQRYTKPKDLVIDPCCGSGTTLDVARDLGRRALGYDVSPQRKDIFRCDARKLPLEDGKVDFVFIDPPYSTHIDYSDDPRCIGKLDAAGPEYYEAMRLVISEIHRVLRPGSYMGLYVSDSFVKGKGFYPIGFELFNIMSELMTPVDIISVVRHNKTLAMGNYRAAAEEGNFFLRGFNYLFIMQKPLTPKPGKPATAAATHPANPGPQAGHHAGHQAGAAQAGRQEGGQAGRQPWQAPKPAGKQVHGKPTHRQGKQVPTPGQKTGKPFKFKKPFKNG